MYIHDDPEVAFLHALDISQQNGAGKVCWYCIGQEFPEPSEILLLDSPMSDDVDQFSPSLDSPISSS